MAKRDVDVVVGARTDEASFRQTEQKTKGFLSRLSGGGGGGDPLQRTAAASERLGKMVQAVALVEAGSRTIEASMNLAAGLSARMRGDMEASADAIEKAYQVMRTAPVIGSVTGAIETVMAMTTHRQEAADIARFTAEAAENMINAAEERVYLAKRLAEQAASENKLRAMEAERWREERLEGLEGYELEIALIKERMRARKDELIVMQRAFRTAADQRRFEIEWNRQRDRMLREIERVEARRSEEARSVIREQMQAFFARFRSTPRVGDGPAIRADDPTIPFRASDPTSVSSSIMRGNRSDGEAAQWAQQLRLSQKQAAEQEKTNGILALLLSATKSQSLAPVLN